VQYGICHKSCNDQLGTLHFCHGTRDSQELVTHNHQRNNRGRVDIRPRGGMRQSREWILPYMVSTVRQHCKLFLSVVNYNHRVLFDLQSSSYERTCETFAITREGNPHRGDFGGGDWSIRCCLATFLCFVTGDYLLQDL